jgi:putative transposase
MIDDFFPQRRTPAKGVHISLGGPNWVFLTVNARERVLFRAKPNHGKQVSKPQVTSIAGRDALPRVRENVVMPVRKNPTIGWLAQPSIQRALHDIWLTSATAWLVTDYLLMPDHIHLFCAPRDLHFTIERWISFWKDCLAKARPETGAFQRGGFHHRLRNAENYAEKWLYVRENPVRAGLVEKAEDWPYQGRIHEIAWSG